jgi:NHLM bacteriocin system ABC transporter peptidase/ATP-binding protein
MADPSEMKSPAVRPRVRAKTPTVIQMEAVECGAACLAMILAYYGKWVPLERVRMDCGVSRDGSKASNMLRAARNYGLVARGARPEVDELKKLSFPMIVFWNSNHFVVVEGYDSKRWYLNDPSSGPRDVFPEDFEESYSDAVLTFEPGPDFQKGGQKPSVINALISRAAGLGSSLTYAVLAGLLLAALGLVIPSFSRVFIDRFLLEGMQTVVRPLLILMGVAIVAQACLTWLQQTALMRLEMKLSLSTSSKFFLHILKLPMVFFYQRYAGEVGSRLYLNDVVASLLSSQLAANIIACVTSVFFFFVMLQYDLVLTLVGVSLALANLLVLKYVSTRIRDLNRRVLQEGGKLSGISMGGLMGIETIKATGSEWDFFSRWAGYQAKQVNSQQESAAFSQLFGAVPTLLSTFGAMAILSLGGLEVMGGKLTIGELMAFQLLMASFSAPFSSLLSMGTQLQQVEADVQRLDDVLKQKPDPQVMRTNGEAPTGEFPPKLTGYLELRDVSFGYSPLDKPLIENFSLKMSPGSRVALVGSSGSGKSTVAKLVTGLFETWSGEILLDGKPKSQFPREVVTNSVGFVDQDIMLFEGTVRENLSLWDETIPDETMVKAAQDACIHDDIGACKNGYNYMIEEGGRNFSGGQRQRLEIARALVMNPTVMILDEATSALDPLTERLIDRNLRSRGCTCLIIAHRLSTVRDCDEIIVMEQGKVVERGTHDEMRNARGPYSRLIREY